ncbi:hypothetical protein IGS68_31100 (plasmid) [Skermanella sp. TT6]|uniref:H+/gluconate symporter-like permease n=1 Tax=Skermanella cutis TaxID=2775420 RepID=A0ABX7BES1_9PROT|nr:hypothetical protein [Skermanella sp. TT6]QQP92887.1 hypothetical protein IGS68_31100 [Skermanella sp. TT6]
MEPVHYVYLCGVAAIVVSMILRTNVVVAAIIATLAVAAAFSGDVIIAITAVFNSSLVAAKELFSIFLVIAFMTALLNALRSLGADQKMVSPLRHVVGNGHMAFLVLASVTYVISLFFWPTPAVPLVVATLLPAAIVAGLSPIGAAMAMAIAGQGMALSSDYVIRVAPSISARAAGLPDATAMVADKALVMSLITGAVALTLGYLAIRRTIKAPDRQHLSIWLTGSPAGEGIAEQRRRIARIGSFNKSVLALRAAPEAAAAEKPARLPPGNAELTGDGTLALDGTVGSLDVVGQGRWPNVLALLTPVVFLSLIAYMLAPKFVPGLSSLKGGEAAALVGGTATLLMLFATFACNGRKAIHIAADHIVDGLVFAFRAMGTVLPIAGFFFLGSSETSGTILGLPAGVAGPALLFEAIQSMQHLIPHSATAIAFGVLVVGIITGIDGSGFSGLPLTGALAGALAPVANADPTTLAAIGQIGSIWTGGGTLVAWSSLIAIAGFVRVPVLELVRALFLPVVAGLFVATLAAVVLW